MGYDPDKDPRNKAGYRAARERMNTAFREAGRTDSRNDWTFREIEEQTRRAAEIKDAAAAFMRKTGDIDPARLRSSSEYKKLKSLAGGDKQARQAIEASKVSGGGKPGIIRRLFG
jgi:hypothetical protein